MLEQPLCYPLKSSAKDLSNEVRPDTFFQLRQTKHFFTHSNTLDQKCHIISKCSHNLKALSILLCLICVSAMNAVPVLAGCYRHTGDCEKFVNTDDFCLKRCEQKAQKAQRPGLCAFQNLSFISTICHIWTLGLVLVGILCPKPGPWRQTWRRARSRRS